MFECHYSDHIGASTEQAQNAVAEETINIIKHFVDGGVVNNCVNKGDLAGADSNKRFIFFNQ